MPRDITDSTSRKKDKHSSRDDLLRDSRKVYDEADEFSKKKGKRSVDDSKSSKKGEASAHSSGRKRLYTDRDANCFASEYDDFEDSKRFVQKSTPVMRQHSRNGLVLPAISNKHSLVDYDDESSNSDSSSESFPPQYPTGKAARRKSAVQVVSASVKADLNDIREQSQKSDTTVSRHVRVSSSSCKKSSTDLVNSDEKSDKKKQRHLPAILPPEPDCKSKDIPAKSPKRRHSKDHRRSRKCDDKEYDSTSEQVNSRKSHLVDSTEKATDLKSVSKENDTKRAKRRDSETEVVSSNVHTEKSKAHKKSKKRDLCEEQCTDDDVMERQSRTNVPKLSATGSAVHKKQKSQKVLNDGFSQSKTSEKSDKQKKISSHSDSVNGTSLSRISSSVQQDERVLKQKSDNHALVHKKHEKEKHSSKKKSRAADDSESDGDKEKKDRSALKRDSQSASCKSDKMKDKRNKDKLRHSRKEREFSDEGQISSDSSGGKVKESKHTRHLHATSRNGSSTPVRSSWNASASSKKAVSSELCEPER